MVSEPLICPWPRGHVHGLLWVKKVRDPQSLSAAPPVHRAGLFLGHRVSSHSDANNHQSAARIVDQRGRRLRVQILKPNDHAVAALKLACPIFALYDFVDKLSIAKVGG